MDRLPDFGAFSEEPPAPPKLDERGVVAMDITQEFKAAAESMFDSALLVYRIFWKGHVLIVFDTELDVGQLIKDPFFTLIEAVGALEVGLRVLSFPMLWLKAKGL